MTTTVLSKAPLRTMTSVAMRRRCRPCDRNSNGIIGVAQWQQRRLKSAPAMNGERVSVAEAQKLAGASSKFTSSSTIPTAAAAAVAAVATVSAAAAWLDRATIEQCPEYSAIRQRFDSDSFAGRFCQMLLACDPMLLAHSDGDVRRAQRLLLQEHEREKGSRKSDHDDDISRPSNAELWQARRIVDAAVHPDTDELVPRPFRMSGYVPYNGPICVAMVTSTSTMPLLAWSWVNQSHNALVNYYNRNASSPMSTSTLATSYAAAVGSALGVAFGLATALKRRYGPAQAKQLMRWVAFPSAVVASSLNCYIVRRPEIATGVPLLDADMRPVTMADGSPAVSSEAASRGVTSTTMSRAILQAPVYLVPPLALAAMRGLVPARILDRHMVPLTTYLLLTTFGVGLPAAIALFPQVATIPASDVEPRFQNLIDPATRRPYEVYRYNKGL